MRPVLHGASPMSVLGFSSEEEEVYRVSLRNPGATVDTLAGLLGRPVEEVRTRLSGFVASGLVEVEDEVVRVRPPDRVLGRLIADESVRLQSAHEQLEALREMLPSLTADHLSALAPKGEPVSIETVEDGDVVQLLRSLAAGSTGDLLWLRPDQWRMPEGRSADEWVKDVVAAGRTSRAIYPALVLEEAPEVVRARAEAGERVRVLGTLPTRLAILGDTAALVPERWPGDEGRRLVVRHHSLVAALQHLFNSMWERALPVPGLDGTAESLRGGEQRLLLDQLASGAKDEQIARALGLSVRTVRRRVAALMEELGAQSRFQAGAEAVRRGWA